MLHAIEKNESALSTEVLRHFFNRWDAVNATNKQPLEEQLRDFFDKWKCKYTQTEFSPAAIEIETEELRQFFVEFKKGLPELFEKRRTGIFSNVWRSAGLKHDELRNSAVLAWLLNCHGDHGQGNAILKCILQSLRARNLEGFPDEIHVNNPYWTRTESCPIGEQESRVDIEIDGHDFLLFIEIKIYSQENNQQLDRYLKIGEQKAQGRPWAVLYLTRDGNLPNGEDRVAYGNAKLVPIKWEWVASILEEYAQKGLSSFASHFIRQFADHIQTF